MKRSLWLLGVGVFLLACITSPVSAVTYPGDNGTVAITKGTPSRIWTVDPASGMATKRTGAGSTRPAWSPDGKLLAYERGGYVFVMTMDSRDIYHIRHNRNVADSNPVWSVDGSRLAFVRTDSARKRSAVYAVGIGSQSPVVISGWSNTDSYRAPSWSPDGKQIVYEAFDAVSARLLIKNTTTGVVRELTTLSDITESSEAAWSPNGKKILFRNSANELYTIWPDGTHRAVISDGDSYSGTWSPDGTRLAFIEDPGDATVSVTDPDGTVRWIPVEKGTYDRLGMVVWLPDGTKLGVTMIKSGRHDLFVLGISSGVQTLLVKDVRGEASWQAR